MKKGEKYFRFSLFSIIKLEGNQTKQGNFSLLKAEKVQFAEYPKNKNLLITKRTINLAIKTNL